MVAVAAQRLAIQLSSGAMFIIGWLLSLSQESIVPTTQDTSTLCTVSEAERVRSGFELRHFRLARVFSCCVNLFANMQEAIRSLLGISGATSSRSCAFNVTLQSLMDP
jgi:hypothetical protein